LGCRRNAMLQPMRPRCRRRHRKPPPRQPSETNPGRRWTSPRSMRSPPQSTALCPISPSAEFLHFPTRGSLTQRYVKRHGTVRKVARVRRFRQFSSPHLALRFPHGFRGGGSHRRRNTSALERVSCSKNPGIENDCMPGRYPRTNTEKHVSQLCPETGVPI
jgi:hypothetical protein